MAWGKKRKKLGEHKPSKSFGGSKKQRIVNNTRKPIRPNPYSKKGALNYDYQNLGLDEDTKTANQLYNRESQYARYERGLTIAPFQTRSRITENFKKVDEYLFDAISQTREGYWLVSVIQQDYYVEILTSITLICAGIYTLTEKDLDTNIPDGLAVWEQVSGNRTVTVLNDLTYTTFKIEGTCFTPGIGCTEDGDPNIVMKIYPRGQPELFDLFIIFTIPISNYTGSLILIDSYDWNPLEDIYYHIHFLPRFPQRAWRWTPPEGAEPVMWFNSEFFELYNYLGSNWYINIDGQYTLHTPLITNNISSIYFGDFYLIQSFYELFGTTTRSRRIHYPFPSSKLDYYFADDQFILNTGFIVPGKPEDIPTDVNSTSCEVSHEMKVSYIDGLRQHTFFDLSGKLIEVIDTTPISIEKSPILRDTVFDGIRDTVQEDPEEAGRIQRRIVRGENQIVNVNTVIVSPIIVGERSHQFLDGDGIIIG